MARPVSHPRAREQSLETCRFLLPCASGEAWAFDVPADLANCVGRYARIPEFVDEGRLLKLVRLAPGRLL
jgi:hypothetical protein